MCEVKGMVRTLRAFLDRKFGKDVGNKHPIMPCMIEYAGVLISRHKVNDNGRTAYEAVRGNKCSVPVCGVAERITFMPAKPAKDCNWKPVIFVGMVRRSNEYVVVGEDGAAVKTREMKRVHEDQIWDKEMMDNIRGTPWAPIGGDKKGDLGIDVPVPPRVM